MRPLTPHLNRGLLLSLLLAATLTAQTATVTVRRGESRDTLTKVRIRQDSIDGVRASKGPQKFNWPADRVVEIVYDSPATYKKAVQAFKEGRFAEAGPLFSECLEKLGRKYSKWLPDYANWYMGECARRMGDLNNAKGYYQKVGPKSRFIAEVSLALAEIGLVKNDGETARGNYKELARLATRYKLERHKGLAELGMATVEARYGDAQSGMKQLQGLLSIASEPTVKNKCRLEIGRTYIRQKEFGKAKTYFEGIQKSMDRKDPDPELIAGAANGLGDCQRFLKDWNAASYSYSKVYALFLDRVDLKEQVSHALYWGGTAFDAASRKAKDPEQQKILRIRGKRLLRKAFQDFKGTRGGELARQRLGM